MIIMDVKISVPLSFEICKCRSSLNHQRWEEEEAGRLHKKGKK